MADAREELRDAIRRGLRMVNSLGDPDLREDQVDSVMLELMGTERDQVGWFILGGLEHVYRVEDAKMTDATATDYSRWDVRTRHDR